MNKELSNILHRLLAIIFMIAFVKTVAAAPAPGPKPPSRAEVLRSIIDATQPLKFPRGQRLPIFAWPAQDVPIEDEAAAKDLLQKLGERGVGVFTSWNF